MSIIRHCLWLVIVGIVIIVVGLPALMVVASIIALTL